VASIFHFDSDFLSLHFFLSLLENLIVLFEHNSFCRLIGSLSINKLEKKPKRANVAYAKYCLCVRGRDWGIPL